MPFDMNNKTPQPLVENPDNIRLAMLGMVAGNGHPYSWSAIINGRYDAQVMAQCGYPVIPEYLGAELPKSLGLHGVRVTHIWCDDPDDARKVADATYIDQVVDDPIQVIGQVDAVVIPTDIGGEHLERARPFIEAGLPVFIDKPLTDNQDDLQQFAAWYREGRPILSTSCMRYSQAFIPLKADLETVGDVRLINCMMAKSWERYGIHALESVYGLLDPGGWIDVVNTGNDERNMIHLRHADGVDVLLSVVADMAGGFGHVSVTGTQGRLEASFNDNFNAFKQQLAAWVAYLRQGVLPFDSAQTIEQMKIIIAGLRSRQEGGRRISLDEIETA